MDTKKFLSLIVIFSIAVMLSFSVLPAMATSGGGVCPGNGNGVWSMGTVEPGTGADKNENGHVCYNLTPNGALITLDDRIPRK